MNNLMNVPSKNEEKPYEGSLIKISSWIISSEKPSQG